jgi:hypothetical protein
MERVLRRMLAVLLASICASSILALHLWMTSDSAGQAGRTFAREVVLFLIGILAFYPYVLIWTAVAYIFLGIPTLVLIKLKMAATWLDYALGGTFVAATSWFVAWTIENGRGTPSRRLGSEPFFSIDLLVTFAIAGFFCGLIYWLLVHRKRATLA